MLNKSKFPPAAPAEKPAGVSAANDQPLPGKHEGGEAESRSASVKSTAERAKEQQGEKPVIPE